MLWNSIEFNQEIKPIVDKIEKDMLGLQVILIKEWTLPVDKVKVCFEISKSRSFNVIEEFIIKIALSEVAPIVSKEMISEMLGLDIIFIEKYINDLIKIGVIDSEKLTDIKITQIGKEYYNRGTVPDSKTEQAIQFFYEPLFGNYYISPKVSSTLATNSNIDVMNEKLPKRLCNVNSDIIQEIGKEKGIVYERVEIGQKITKIVPANILEHSKTSYAEIWMYDIVENEFFCRVWDFAKSSFIVDVATFINNEITPNKNEFTFFKDEEFSNTTAPYIERYENTIRDIYTELRIKKDNIKNMKTVSPIRLIRGADIKPEFNSVMKKVKNRLLIFCPWITSNVVDDEMISNFRNIAKNGGSIYIGWGISKTREEERYPSDNLLQKLKNIKNIDGTPAVFINWIGNHHTKEILVDDKIHMAGSFNWLSYRGDYLPRGESVYVVTDKDSIIEATEYWENLFFDVLISQCNEEKNMSNYDQLSISCALINLGSLSEKVDEFFDSYIKTQIKNKSNKKIFNILLLHIYKKHYSNLIVTAIDYLIKDKQYQDDIRTILSIVYLNNKGLFNILYLKMKELLLELNICNEKGKLNNIKKTSLKYI